VVQKLPAAASANDFLYNIPLMKQWLRMFYRLDPLRFFIIMSAVFGMAFLLITPPFQGADEPVHFMRAYQVSEGQLVASRASGKIGGYLPSDLAKVFHTTDNPSVQFYPQNKYPGGYTRDALGIPNSGQKTFYEFSASASYPPTAYPVSSFGMLVARILSLPSIVTLYAGRLGNLLTWIILIGAAIYFLPRRKWALVAIGLLPMALFQASTLNGDAITLGTLALFIALIFRFRDEKKVIPAKMLGLFLVVVILMVLSKYVMFLFLPLVFLLKKESFSSNWRSRLIKAGMIAVPIIFLGIWILVSQSLSTVQATNANAQNPTKQLHFIIANPHSYVNVLWNTYFYTWGDGATRSLIGDFGWADTPLSEAIVVVGYIGLFVVLTASYEGDRKKEASKRWSKWLPIGTGVLYWLAVSTAMYVYYSPVGFKIIVGLQGRYFIPLLLLAVPLARIRDIQVERSLYRKFALYIPLFLLVCSVITLYVRYYINNV
jgi:uncharacterized membrane protein